MAWLSGETFWLSDETVFCFFGTPARVSNVRALVHRGVWSVFFEMSVFLASLFEQTTYQRIHQKLFARVQF
jgi:hypothetical protein